MAVYPRMESLLRSMMSEEEVEALKDALVRAMNEYNGQDSADKSFHDDEDDTDGWHGP